jgi:acyl-CoA reductase-like NAD-dependent aldehyde dehydrogenase
MGRSTFFDSVRSAGVYHYFAEGTYRASSSGNLIDVRSPVDGSVLGSTQAVTRDEVDAVIASAWRQFRAGATRRSGSARSCCTGPPE